MTSECIHVESRVDNRLWTNTTVAEIRCLRLHSSIIQTVHVHAQTEQSSIVIHRCTASIAVAISVGSSTHPPCHRMYGDSGPITRTPRALSQLNTLLQSTTAAQPLLSYVDAGCLPSSHTRLSRSCQLASSLSSPLLANSIAPQPGRYGKAMPLHHLEATLGCSTPLHQRQRSSNNSRRGGHLTTRTCQVSGWTQQSSSSHPASRQLPSDSSKRPSIHCPFCRPPLPCIPTRWRRQHCQHHVPQPR